MTETSLVRVVCPDCRHEFDVPDGAAEAQCPQCGEQIVWRSCLDTNEVFTVLKKWETWVHPGCETKHPVDLTHVLSAARPQDLDPNLAPVPRHGALDQGGIAAQQTVYSPVELAEDVEWADQDISGRLIVDSDRLAILPGAGATRPPLSVAWVRDVISYAVDRIDPNAEGKKRSRFGRRKEGKDAVVRLSRVVLTVPGGQISITSTAQPDVLLSQLDQFLQPRISTQAPAAAPETVASEPPAPETAAPEPPAPEVSAPESSASEPSMSEPGAPEPEPATSQAADTDTATPETATSETATPETATPEAADDGQPSEVATTETAASEASVTTGPETVVAETTGPETTGPETTRPETTAPETVVAEAAAPETTAPEPAEAPSPAAAPIQGAGPQPAGPVEMPDLEPDTPEAVYESIRKLAELAVLGTISSEEFATKKAGLLARL